MNQLKQETVELHSIENAEAGGKDRKTIKLELRLELIS